MFADLLAMEAFFATLEMDATVWGMFAVEFLRHNGHPKASYCVAIEMSAASNKGVSGNHGNAQLVYDKFHVIPNL